MWPGTVQTAKSQQGAEGGSDFLMITLVANSCSDAGDEEREESGPRSEGGEAPTIERKEESAVHPSGRKKNGKGRRWHRGEAFSPARI